MGLWVYHQVSQGTTRDKVHLSQEVDLLIRWHGDCPLHQRPQLPNDSKEAGLATAVATGHQDPLTPLNGEVQVLHQQSSIWPVTLKHARIEGAHPSGRLVDKHLGKNVSATGPTGWFKSISGVGCSISQ